LSFTEDLNIFTMIDYDEMVVEEENDELETSEEDEDVQD
jgi:hypothetical protein